MDYELASLCNAVNSPAVIFRGGNVWPYWFSLADEATDESTCEDDRPNEVPNLSRWA